MWFSRYLIYASTVVLTLVFIALSTKNPHFLWGVLVFAPLAILGTKDIVQARHSVLRN